MRTKYFSRKVNTDKGTFDSMGEYRRFLKLEFDQKEGLISGLERQVSLTIQDGFKDRQTGKKIRAITYKPDFVYFCEITKIWIIEDFKGFETADFKIKKKMLLKKISEGGFDEEYPDCIFVMTRCK